MKKNKDIQDPSSNFEDKIIEWIIKKAEGRITVYRPTEEEATPEERKTDLVVKKRAKYKEDILHLKIETTGHLREKNMVVKDVIESDFRVAKNSYLIFAYFDPIERKINDYIWLIPSSEFKKLAVPKDQKTYQPKLRFEAPLTPDEKSKYSPFLIEKEDLVDILLKILVSPEEFEFSQAPRWETKRISIPNLKEFIIEARESTWAVGEGKVGNPRLMGSSQFEYQKANFFYRDIYFDGNKNFAGQEVVYQNQRPVWSMIYFGTSSSKEVTDFLKKSLLKLSQKCRLGQECNFKEEKFKYQDRGGGTIEEFSGQENILKNGEQVYTLNYRGGLISKKT